MATFRPFQPESPACLRSVAHNLRRHSAKKDPSAVALRVGVRPSHSLCSPITQRKLVATLLDTLLQALLTNVEILQVAKEVNIHGE